MYLGTMIVEKVNQVLRFNVGFRIVNFQKCGKNPDNVDIIWFHPDSPPQGSLKELGDSQVVLGLG
jgi:hypothetical protein